MPTSGGVYARALLESEVEAERIAARNQVRTRLRHLVQRIDELVEVCEAAHLGETRRAPDELVQNVFEVLAQARSVLPDGRGAGVCDAMLVRAAAARDPLVRHLM